MKFKLPNPKKIVLLYLLAGFLLIFLLSQLAGQGPSSGFFPLEQLKDYLFIAVTAIILFLLLKDYHRQLKSTLDYRRQTETQFRKLYEESPQPTWIVGGDKRLLFMNKAAKELLGYPPEEPVKILPEELMAWIEWEKTSGGLMQQNEEEVKEDVQRFVSSSGKLLYLDLMVQQIEYEARKARLVIANNVTSLVEAEKDKKRINNELYHYKKALDRSALLSVTDLNGSILDVNHKFSEISKFSREELIGKNHNIVNSGYHPPSFFKDMYQTIRKGEVWRNEICNRAKDGALFWVDMSVIPVIDEFSEVGRYMAISYPITDRKAAEIKSEKVQHELITFMYKASHNLRGPVATLCGLLNVARIEVKEASSLRYIQLLDERTKHLEYTLSELIDITKVKQEELKIETIHFEGLIKKELRAFAKDLKEHSIQIDVQSQLCTKFRNDKKLLGALFHYLIDNAIKFRNNDNPLIRIQVRSQSGGVFISVSDNGPGIAEEIRGRIYEMYFRGSEKSTGSGLGLYIVSSIVDRLAGFITLYSKAGSGSTFTVFLPDALKLEKLRKSQAHIHHTYLPDKNLYQHQAKTDSLQPDL